MRYGGSMNTTSAATCCRSIRQNARGKSSCRILNPLAIPRFWRLARIASAADAECSTKYTSLAPLLRASIPTAPVPANRSSQTLPSSADEFPAVNTLNKVSRSRSEVGRTSIPRTDRNGRLRYLPAITRMACPVGCHLQYIYPCRIKVTEAYEKLVHSDRTVVWRRRPHPPYILSPSYVYFLDGVCRPSGQRQRTSRSGTDWHHPGLCGRA